MNRALIVARIRPGSEAEVARIFAESDEGPLPHDLGVSERSLYSLRDLYVHLIDFDEGVGSVEKGMAVAQQKPEFHRLSALLSAHISAYEPESWRSPRDAMARRFYHWQAARGWVI